MASAQKARHSLAVQFFGKIFCSLALGLLSITGAFADDPLPVDLELVLAVDASASIDTREAALQRAGYISALKDPRVLARIAKGSFGRIAVSYVEWAGSQKTIVDWMIVEDEASAETFAVALRAAPFHTGTTTSISAALDYSARLFEDNNIDSLRRVIDISGDGFNWAGRPIDITQPEIVAAGITINALPILRFDEDGRNTNPGLDKYYRERVIGGPGAFLIPIYGSSAFAEAILRKLIIEIAGISPADLPQLAQLPGHALTVKDVDAARRDDRSANEGSRLGEVAEEREAEDRRPDEFSIGEGRNQRRLSTLIGEDNRPMAKAAQ